MKVLYIDDNEEVRHHAAAKINGLGHRALPVASFEEAAKILREGEVNVQLVIADHKMAGDGFSFVLGLQQAFPQTKVCVLSQEITRSDANQLEQAGIAFFRKPVLLENVLKEVRVPPPVKKPSVDSPPKQDGLLAQAKSQKRSRGPFGLFR